MPLKNYFCCYNIKMLDITTGNCHKCDLETNELIFFGLTEEI